jgi:putative OPT family oligopeptide transporter
MSEAPKHKPYVSASTILPELTPLPLIVGTLLGIVFGAASLYLALKIGLTISASIPIAVMSISIFKWISRAFGTRQATILENNMVQTTGSAGESIAFGVAVTMPALMILGHDMDLPRIITVAVLGGLLGILMMIPLRRGLIVKEHGKLAYPEGTACAEVLIAGEKGGTNAKTVFTGFGVGFLFKLLNGDGGFTVFKNTPEKLLSWFKGGSISAECSPELLGVGYIIGPRIAGIMCAGGVLAYLVLIPAIKIFGDGLSAPLFPATQLIRDMSPHEVRNAYVLYIGAGAVAAGGIISLLRVIPTIVAAFAAGLKNLAAGRKGAGEEEERTDRDLSIGVVIFGCILLVLALMLLPSLHVSLSGALLILLFGFLFVTVSSRLTGEIGSSSNPISGMTVATLLLTCLIFLALGWTSLTDRVAALSIAAVVCIASSNGGTTSQDLKTGFLVGGTPRSQQIGILVGALTSALVIGGTLKLFNDAKTIFARQDIAYHVDPKLFEGKDTLHGTEASRDSAVYNVVHFTGDDAPRNAAGAFIVEPGRYLVDDSGTIRYLVDPGINGRLSHRDPLPGETVGTEVKKFDAPKARLMSLIIDGILTRKLPWGLVLLGVFIAFTLELCGVASLPFAVGVYLPISASTPIWIGGLVRWLVEKQSPPRSDAESESSPGVLLSSGLIAGGAIAGMVLAIIAGASESFSKKLDFSASLGDFASSDLVAILLFLGLGGFVYMVGREKLLAAKS